MGKNNLVLLSYPVNHLATRPIYLAASRVTTFSLGTTASEYYSMLYAAKMASLIYFKTQKHHIQCIFEYVCFGTYTQQYVCIFTVEVHKLLQAAEIAGWQ